MTTIDPLVFGHRLRHFRREREMTLDDLGTAVGRPAPFLSLVENGKREPRLSEVGALAQAVGVTVADLLEQKAPNRRADLEIRLQRAQEHPRYEELGLPYLKPTAKTPDEAIEHIVTLFDQITAKSSAGNSDELRKANGEITRWLRRRDGYLADIEERAREALDACGYEGRGPLTTRHLIDIADHVGYSIHLVDDIPTSARSVVDHAGNRIYVAQRNELRTRQARKAILQTIGAIVLDHRRPRSPLEMLRQRLESAYFAAAVLLPEDAAVPFLDAARSERDLSVEDLKERFYVSYEMAAQRFCNLATVHLGIRSHFVRSDEHGRIHKAYANDAVPLPEDDEGGSEGMRLCRRWGARAAFGSAQKFDIHYQFTDTPTGSYWCATHIATDLSGDAFTVGVRFEDARLFRGRNTGHQRLSRCPDGPCCLTPEPELESRWGGRVEAHVRLQGQVLGVLWSGIGEGPEPAELFEFAQRHSEEMGHEDPSHRRDGG